MAVSAAQVALATVVVLAIVIIALVVSAVEHLRKRGKVGVSIRDAYKPSAVFLAPYNRWLSKRSVGGSPPFLSMGDHFPDHEVLRGNWKTIRAEALALHKITTSIRQDKYFRKIADGGWKKFYLKWYGDILPEARALCPKTCSLLDKLPDTHLAMFSILEPGARITPHRGPFAGSARYHLGLLCPKGAAITVDGTPYEWAEGEDVLFDDTYVHEVANDTDGTRTILFVDVERKLDCPKAQRLHHWACKKLGPLSNRVNNRLEKSSRTA